jgi:hypothetical protein
MCTLNTITSLPVLETQDLLERVSRLEWDLFDAKIENVSLRSQLHVLKAFAEIDNKAYASVK